MLAENEDQSFTFIAKNGTITDNKEPHDNSYGLVTIIIITGISIISCFILSGLAYLYYKNYYNTVQTNNIIETTSAPFQGNIDVSIGFIEDGDRDSNLSSFLGQTES